MVTRRQQVGIIWGLIMVSVAAFHMGVSTVGAVGHPIHAPEWYDWLLALGMILWGTGRCLNPEYE